MSLGGALVGAVFGLTVIPELIATAPLFEDAWYVENVLLAIFAIGGMIGLMIRAGAVQGISRRSPTVPIPPTTQRRPRSSPGSPSTSMTTSTVSWSAP